MKRYLIKYYRNNDYIKINFNKDSFASCKKEDATLFVTLELANTYKAKLEKFYKDMQFNEKFIIEEI